jgi:hypothetical protein
MHCLYLLRINDDVRCSRPVAVPRDAQLLHRCLFAFTVMPQQPGETTADFHARLISTPKPEIVPEDAKLRKDLVRRERVRAALEKLSEAERRSTSAMPLPAPSGVNADTIIDAIAAPAASGAFYPLCAELNTLTLGAQ